MPYRYYVSQIDNHLVRAVINETLRLYPPVPLNVRESRESSCVLPPSDNTYANTSSWYMPSKTTILYLPLLTQRNKSLWGEDVEQFNPERWIDPKRIAHFVSNPTIYTPFSAGPRIVRDCFMDFVLYSEPNHSSAGEARALLKCLKFGLP